MQGDAGPGPSGAGGIRTGTAWSKRLLCDPLHFGCWRSSAFSQKLAQRDPSGPMLRLDDLRRPLTEDDARRSCCLWARRYDRCVRVTQLLDAVDLHVAGDVVNQVLPLFGVHAGCQKVTGGRSVAGSPCAHPWHRRRRPCVMLSAFGRHTRGSLAHAAMPAPTPSHGAGQSASRNTSALRVDFCPAGGVAAGRLQLRRSGPAVLAGEKGRESGVRMPRVICRETTQPFPRSSS